MESPFEASRKKFGECSIAFEPPDLVHTTASGELTTQLVTEMFEEFYRLDGRGAPRYGLVGLGQLRLRSTEVRRLAIAKSRTVTPALGTAIYCGLPQMRMIFSLFMRALSLVIPRYSERPMRFFETEAEARAWLDDQRKRVSWSEALRGSSPP